ncbi:MAG: hypothetical protein DMG32_26575 [Acidobacteria bacterium]|nr:MAG: hypothetical protein DMG32_26575 [Acidobacteriota bacterium]
MGIEATVSAQWFEKVLREYHHELWVGDAAEIRAMRVRKQKTDWRDALHILDLLLTTDSLASGFRLRPSEMSGNWCGIDISWFACGPR